MGKASRSRKIRAKQTRCSRSRAAAPGPANGLDGDAASLAERGLEVITRTLTPVLTGGTRRANVTTIAEMFSLGYGSLGVQKNESADSRLDQLDLVDLAFLGAVFPEMPDVPSLMAGRAGWVRAVYAAGHGQQIDELVRAGVEACEIAKLDLSHPQVWLITATLLENNALARRPLPSALLPSKLLKEPSFARYLGAHTPAPLPEPVPAAALQAFLDLVDMPLPSKPSLRDLLRAGFTAAESQNWPAMFQSLLLGMYVTAFPHVDASDPAELVDTDVRAWLAVQPEGTPMAALSDAFTVMHDEAMRATSHLADEEQHDEYALLMRAGRALAHLLAIPGLDDPLPAAVRTPVHLPGEAAADIAFDLGVTRTLTYRGTQVQLSSSGSAILRTQLEEFEARFGRPPGHDDPIFFDPNADEPTPFDAATMADLIAEPFERMDAHPATVAAIRESGLHPLPDGFGDEHRQQDWDDALDKVLLAHPQWPAYDDDKEEWIARMVLISTTLRSANDMPEVGKTLSQALLDSPDEPLHDLLLETFDTWEESLLSHLSPERMTHARQLARMWAGPALAAEVEAVTSGKLALDWSVDRRAVLALAAAAMT